ncbi:MAG: NAD(P)/FAD-dependent oxidoreductase, partial [Cellvibrionaceae bacterium]|nr:NAD(P)/FAD-dependent oxidoreductase [Cellvibrionaceae bacterium]
WSKWSATGPEILEYIKHCARKYDIYQHIRFNAAVSQASWQDNHWAVRTADGEELQAQFVISAMGGLHTPNIPKIDGLDNFTGPVFHTSNWQHDIDMKAKRVAVIGTGATAVQCVPELAKEVAELYVFQRSPVWVGPKSDPVYSEEEKQAFRDDPNKLHQHRWTLWRNWETTGLDMVRAGSDINTLSERRARELIARSVQSPELAAKLTPEYNFTCKRPTFSNDYYATYEKPNVHLLTSPIEAISASSISCDGVELDVDVVVLATGFKPFNITNEVDIYGSGGVALSQLWQDRISSYKSMMVPGLPNFFFMLGPNSGGLTSILQMIERQSDYIMRTLEMMQVKHASTIAPKQVAADAFCERVQQATAKTTHNKGCSSWWADEQGYNHSIWPESSITYKMLLKHVDWNDFEVAYAAGATQ